MKAFVMTGYGGPEVSAMQEMPVPKPGQGEVLVRVHAAGLNPVDYKIRDGSLKAIRRYKFPQVMGCEIAGVVEAVGEGVHGFAPGDRVFSRVATETLGAFAECAVVSQELLAKLPDGLEMTAAAGIPLAGLTALQALRDEMGVKLGDRIFISGGAGGVGTFAIQIARALGAEVATTASPRGKDLVERLGAAEVIDYTVEQFQNKLRNMDGAFDLMGGDTLDATFGVVKPGGMVVSVAGMPEPETARRDLGFGWLMQGLFWLISRKQRALAKKHGVRYRYIFMHPSGAELAELGQMVTDGKLQPVIDKVFPFDQIGDAMAYLEAGRAKGKVVVQMV